MNKPISLDIAYEKVQLEKLDKATRRSPPPGSELDQKLAFFPLTDLGNAERFVERNRDRFLWCSTVGWFGWDGKRWDPDGAEESVLRAVHDTVRAIQIEAAAIRDTDHDMEIEAKKDGEGVMLSDKLASWGRSSEAASKLSPIAKHARAYLTVKPSAFDVDPMQINVLNGTLTVARHPIEPYVTLTPHNPTDRITKIAPVIYDPNADCPAFDGFLLRVQPDLNNRRFLNQWSGLSLTGDISEQKLVFHWGTGRNGKSVYVDAVGYVAGDYGATIPIETFIKSGQARGGGDASPDLARLPGIRMLRTSEPEQGAKLAEALIKLATGGEPMDARHLNKPFFSFKPSFKLTIQGNYRPKVDGTDEGIWGRLNLVPWCVFIPKEERDPKLGEKLKAEASGILNHLLSGLCDWLDNGLVIPPDVEAATETYRADSDPIGRFLAVCTKPTIGHRTQATVLHELYVAWAKVNGEASRSANALGRDLRARGMPEIKSGVQWWVDLETTKLPSEFVDNYGEPLHADENAYRRYRDGE